VNSQQRRLMAKLAAQYDFELTETARGHARFVSRRNGEIVYGSGTPSDRRAWKNIRAQLKRVAQGAQHQRL